MLHKPYTQLLEAAGLYREIKRVMAEDAARRKSATQFSSGTSRGRRSRKICGTVERCSRMRAGAGCGDDSRRCSHTTLEKIGYLEDSPTTLLSPRCCAPGCRGWSSDRGR